MEGIYSYETKAGTKWRVNKQVKDPVTDKPIKIQKKGLKGKKEAEAYLTDALSKIYSGNFIVNSKATINELLDEWYERRVTGKLKPTTCEGYLRNIKHIKKHLGEMQLQKLRFEHIEDFYEELSKNGRLDGKGGLSGKSIQYVHRVFSLALNYAVKKELIQKNVAKFAERPEVKRYKPQILRKEEMNGFLKALKGTNIEVPVMLGLLGLRRGEVCGLSWDQVDLENHTLDITQNLVKAKWGIYTPKSEKSIRMVPIPDFIVDLLKRHKTKQKRDKLFYGKDYQDNNMVVCKDDGGIRDPNQYSKDFKKFLEDNSMKHIRFHDLRHSYASIGYESGVELKEISELLGHSTIQITSDIYVHISDEKKRESQKNITNAIFGEMSVREMSKN